MKNLKIDDLMKYYETSRLKPENTRIGSTTGTVRIVWWIKAVMYLLTSVGAAHSPNMHEIVRKLVV